MSLDDSIPCLDGDADDHAGHGGRDMGRVGEVRFDVGYRRRLQRPVNHFDFARLAIELKEDRSRTVRMRMADSGQFNDESFPGLNVDGGFLT